MRYGLAISQARASLEIDMARDLMTIAKQAKGERTRLDAIRAILWARLG
ncbi:hypothetical protein NKDENANG_02773 [Candidatus Entotheonellaceae bacterium PAL068K]